MKKIKNVQISEGLHTRLKAITDSRHQKIRRVVEEVIEQFVVANEPAQLLMTKSGPLVGPEVRFPEG